MTLEQAYERMLAIRRFEEEIERLFLRVARSTGPRTCASARRPSPWGSQPPSRPDDLVAATYRGHGHALALRRRSDRLAAELMGRETGTCGGRAGSMNVVDLDHGLIGCFGIVGGTMAAATGAGFALPRAAAGSRSRCSATEPTNQAYFAECLNFAAVFDLPVVFVCEHNLYGEYTPWERVTAGADIPARSPRSASPRGPSTGWTCWPSSKPRGEAVAARARATGRRFLECRTYRFVGHSRTDPAATAPRASSRPGASATRSPLAASALRARADERGDEVDATSRPVEARIADSFEPRCRPLPAAPGRSPEYCDA